MDSLDSRLPGFRHLPPDERLSALSQAIGMDPQASARCRVAAVFGSVGCQERHCAASGDREAIASAGAGNYYFIAQAEQIPVHERSFTPEVLLSAQEAFLTGTTAGVWPIESVDRNPLGACPGPISTRLRDRFRRVAGGDDPAFKSWLTPVAD